MSLETGIRLEERDGRRRGVTALVSALFILGGQIEEAALRFGFIPARVGGMTLDGALPVWLTPWSATLVHGGWLHLIFNLVMLLWVGAQVERVLGPANLLFAYLVGALVAAAAQWLADPAAFTPMIGASGAISAIFGIYALFEARPKAVTALAQAQPRDPRRLAARRLGRDPVDERRAEPEPGHHARDRGAYRRVRRRAGDAAPAVAVALPPGVNSSLMPLRAIGIIAERHVRCILRPNSGLNFQSPRGQSDMETSRWL